jgi:hypothetical protein
MAEALNNVTTSLGSAFLLTGSPAGALRSAANILDYRISYLK